jgi:CCR4-NOT transcription complex subunit 1
MSGSNTPGVDLSAASEYVLYYIYLAFTNCLHLLRPQRVVGFAFAWLEIVAHRTFLSRFLTPGGRFQRQTHNMYALLLVDALRLVTPFLRSGEHTAAFQVYFKGILRTFMLLLHDFPEFLCEYYYQFCDALPLAAHQLRNIVLSSFPKHVRCPDPFLVNFKVNMLNDISIVPVIAYNFANNIQPPKFKANLDSYLRTRAPVTFLSELRSYLQQGADPGSHYNIRMLNALVLYVATQALSILNNKTSAQPIMSSITHSAHMDIFQNLAVDLDTEGRYIFLNAMVNHLRYPNTHTHYFSNALLYLFAEANSEALQEQIVRVLLERLVAVRPHPWGLLITFLELVRNPSLKLWTREFMSITPDVKQLLETLTRGFPHATAQPMGSQREQQQPQSQQTTIVKP